MFQVELCDNQIKSSDLKHLIGNQNIATLKLANNKIAKVSDLQCLVSIHSPTDAKLLLRVR